MEGLDLIGTDLCPWFCHFIMQKRKSKAAPSDQEPVKKKAKLTKAKKTRSRRYEVHFFMTVA